MEVVDTDFVQESTMKEWEAVNASCFKGIFWLDMKFFFTWKSHNALEIDGEF